MIPTNPSTLLVMKKSKVEQICSWKVKHEVRMKNNNYCKRVIVMCVLWQHHLTVTISQQQWRGCWHCNFASLFENVILYNSSLEANVWCTGNFPSQMCVYFKWHISITSYTCQLHFVSLAFILMWQRCTLHTIFIDYQGSGQDPHYRNRRRVGLICYNAVRNATEECFLNPI